MAKRKGTTKERKLGLRWLVAFLAMAILGAVLVLLQSSVIRPLPVKNPYSAEDFAYVDGYLTCLVGESVTGIDVSSHQGEIDWQQVKAAGVEFAIIRLGYRGYETGLLHEDTYARENLKNARAAGLKIGAYFFSQAITAEEAKEEAKFALEILEGMPLDFPLAYDWEYISEAARTGNVTGDILNSCVATFCEAVRGAEYAPMVYFNQELADTRLDITKFLDYPHWLAMYSGEMTYPYRIQMWQYTDDATVPGINGAVDLNLYFP